MSDNKKSTNFTWGGARTGAGRPKKRVRDAASVRALSVVELVPPDPRGTIAVVTSHGIRIEGLTFEQMLRLLGGLA